LLYDAPKILEEILEQMVNRAKEFLNRAEKNGPPTLDISESSDIGNQTNLGALIIDDAIVEQFRHMNFKRATALDVLLKLKNFRTRPLGIVKAEVLYCKARPSTRFLVTLCNLQLSVHQAQMCSSLGEIGVQPSG
jgi:hypothetical protein